MLSLQEYIKENLDLDNFDFKFDTWFQSDKEHLKPMLELFLKCRDRKIVLKDDIEQFLTKYNTFKVKKFVDFFDEDVTRDESINVDYVYLLTKIIEHYINNFVLMNKIDYKYQALYNGQPNVDVDTPPMADDNDKKEGEN